MQDRGIWKIGDRCCEQLQMQEFQSGLRGHDLAQHGAILHDAKAASIGFDCDHDVRRGRPDNLGCAIEKPDRIMNGRVRRLEPKSALMRSRDYFVLDWSNPSLMSEPMQALISSWEEAPRSKILATRETTSSAASLPSHISKMTAAVLLR